MVDPPDQVEVDQSDHDESTPAGRPYDHGRQLWKEGVTMALYVAICLLAALTAVSDEVLDHADVVGIIWGGTLGLALAHWFAFQVSARLAGAGTMSRHDAEDALAQLVGAALVAVLVTLPVLLVQRSTAFSVARLVLAGFVAAVGYVVARSAGASWQRSTLYAGSVLVLAMGVVIVKNALVPH